MPQPRQKRKKRKRKKRAADLPALEISSAEQTQNIEVK